MALGRRPQVRRAVYRARAQFLREGRGFLNPDEWFFNRHAAQGAVHPPGNALFIALGDIVGFHTDDGYQLWACALGAATIVVVGLAGRAVAGPRVGLIAAAIAAVSPAFWSYDPTLMAETPGQFLVALTLLLAYRFWDSPTASRAAWLGGVAGLAALTRSELVILIPMLVLPLCFAARGSGRQVALRLGAAVLWATAVLGPWVGWNMVRFEHPATLATGLDISLVYAQCDDTWYGPNTGYWNVFCGAEIQKEPGNEFADESELGRQYRIRAGEYISEHKGRWPVVVAARVGRTLSIYRPVQQIHLEAEREGREEAVLWGALLATTATVALAVVAFVKPPRSRKHLLPLLVPLAAGAAGAAITFGTTRYRSAGEVGLTILAAVGIDALLRLRARRAGDPDGDYLPTGPRGSRP
ncbi:ArnT family glycosyltransferase [Aquihabitans daechungensis]|uniref:ArnT family glycosyltransferase n=1 Tax=Aquihabitans daechungensis TaxID=1052257 RepID=UPI003BA2CB89